MVAVSANNKDYGTVEGGGLYELGEKVTVKAMANQYCYFLNWTENDNVVSTDAEYAFYINSSDRNLVANFAKISVPENIEATALSASSVSLSWDAVEDADSYNVYRDGKLLKNVNTNSYLDEGLEAYTEYCYTVTAVRNDEESEESDEECVKTLGESINELLFSSINIYPNPVKDELFIATEVRVKEIAIYDVYGRQTMSQQVNETTSQQVVEVAELEAGVYFMKVVTNEGEIVKRFVKK